MLITEKTSCTSATVPRVLRFNSTANCCRGCLKSVSRDATEQLGTPSNGAGGALASSFAGLSSRFRELVGTFQTPSIHRTDKPPSRLQAHGRVTSRKHLKKLRICCREQVATQASQQQLAIGVDLLIPGVTIAHCTDFGVQPSTSFRQPSLM
jgi:hypothetical protein